MKDWLEILWTSVYLSLPLILGGTLHMSAVKLDVLPALKVPVYAPLFGANKTWRGFVVMPIVTSLATLFLGLFEDPGLNLFGGPMSATLGALLGIAYVLFELPNSFLKRRLGVAPGELSKDHRFFFFLLDHLDSLMGCAIVYFIWRSDLTPAILALFVVGPGVHIGVNLVLYVLRIRKQPF